MSMINLRNMAFVAALLTFGIYSAWSAPPYTGNTSGTDSAAILNTLTDTYTLLNAGTPVSGSVEVTQSTSSSLKVEPNGSAASGASDTGNPVKVGAVYNSTFPTVTNGQRVDMQADSRGSIHALACGQEQASCAGTAAVHFDGAPATVTGLTVRAVEQLYNGSTIDGAFTCASQASVSVTAGNTTQIIALSGSTVIRICSVSLGMSANGTVAFTSGTGSNCGTPANAMAAINLNTGTMWQQSAPAGGSLYRGSAGGEFCITAATGNVTGFVTYAQF